MLDAQIYFETYKLNKTQYKPLEQFFYFEKGRGTVKMKEFNITKLMLIEGIADMIKYAIEIQQNIHRIELLEYKRQIDVINIMIAKYKLWTRKDINTISAEELNKANFFHNKVFKLFIFIIFFYFLRLKFILGQIKYVVNYFLSSAWAAESLATGTLNGEQET